MTDLSELDRLLEEQDMAEARKSKTHCRHGHSLAGTNLVLRKTRTGTVRLCRLCKRAQGAASKRAAKLRPLPPLGAEAVLRFWAKVTEGECWEWQGQRDLRGYGRFVFQSRKLLATHVAWELVHGEPVPKGLYVCHHCDNPPCVRPSHLYVGTATDNARDRSDRGHTIRGAQSPLTHLTADQIREIRNSSDSQRAVARRLCIGSSSVGRIRRRETWASIE